MSNIVLMTNGNHKLDYKRMVFAGGEVHVNVDGIGVHQYLKIIASIRSSDDLMEVLLLHDALKRNGCTHTCLEITYLPYARQDRVCTKGDAFSLEIVTSMIVRSDFEHIIVHDCHSQIGIDLLSRGLAHVVDYTQANYLVYGGYKLADNAIIVAPDQGAAAKSNATASAFGVPCYTASKVRNPVNGQLTGFTLNVSADKLKGKHVYIFDDICDGGGTFLGLGKLIQECEPEQMTLYTTNAIYSNPQNHVALAEMYNLESTFDWRT